MPENEHEISPTDHTEIFKYYGPVILNYLRLHLSSREEAEDLTLDVFTAALNNQQLLTWSGTRQLGWLKRVASNKLVDFYRRTQRRPVVPLDQITETLLDEDDPELVALRKEDYTQLYEQIQKLPPLQQQLLRLRYGHGLQTAEIAELFNKSDQAIRQMLSRTIGQLRLHYSTSMVKKGGRA